MATLVHHALLAGAIAGLVAAAVRLVSQLTPRGLERAVAVMPVAAALAVSWALGLGLAKLGTDSVALALSAGATWLAARRFLPAPDVPLSRDAAEAWAALRTPARMALGAGAAAAAAYAVFVLRHPQLGTDAVIYHLPDVVAWIVNGRPGTSVDLLYGLPVGNYPQAHETLLAWGTGLSRGFAFAGLSGLLMLLVLISAGWLGMRSARVPRLAAALALAALCTGPLVVDAMRAPGTDLPSLAWLVVAAALVAASRQRPPLLAIALLAAALGIGTKTTVAPLALVVLGVGLWIHRASLRAIRRPLLMAAAGSLVVGGTWYIRNLIGHGSPLWPLIELPWSDPVPDLVDRLDYSVLDRPRQTLEGNLDMYERRLAGYLMLLAAAILAPLAARRRAVTLTALAAAGSLLLWLNAPFTGAGDSALERPFLSTVRYLLPAAAAAALCLALAARASRVGRVFGLGALVLALAWNLTRVLQLDFPARPSLGTLVTAAAIGAAAAAALGHLPRVPSPRALRAATAGALAGFAVAGTIASDGYVSRHLRAAGPATTVPYSAVLGMLQARADFRDSDERVSMAPGVSAMYAGDTLQREVVLIPQDEPCPAVEARARHGWVVIADLVADSVPPYTARRCFEGRRPLLETGPYRVYRD